MRFFVKWTVFSSIQTDEDVARVRGQVAQQVKTILDSGKMESGDFFADARSGYFVVNVNTPMELSELMIPGILDHCITESHPLNSYQEMAPLFERLQGRF